MARIMEISTPLDPQLLFHNMHATEEIGRLSEYQIGLLSLKKDVDLNALLGKKVTVTLGLPDDTRREFSGYVTRIAQHGLYGKYHRYVATVSPWLWFLTRTSDCRIFQDMTVQQIVEAVFADHPGIVESKFELTGSYRVWPYCVQYRETDFNFVSRLLEHDGIYYYFKHEDGKNLLVLTDSYSGHEVFTGYNELPIVNEERLLRPDLEYISEWQFAHQVQPGVYVHRDYDLERPTVDLLAKKALPREYSLSSYEVYDYPGHYVKKPDGEQYAAVRIDEYGSQFATIEATTNARGLAVGHLITVTGHAREDQNREYLVTQATYDMEFSDYEAMPDRGGASYRCSFVAMSSKQQLRPRRATAKPFVQGPQTAVVVGPAGDEIYTDKYGRVKVLFHWDREGEKKKDETCSCWIRVSQPWAGKQWGGVTIPRIGQEVIVDFLEGDPDQPIITGRVYNAEQMPPYALPANMTQSGLKSRSSKGGTPDNFNEIRFEDKKGSEQLFIHAEKNQDIEVENDETHWVGHDRRKTIDHDETTLVKHDRTETVDNNETITIHGNRSETVDKNETITIAKNRTESVGENESISVGKDQAITISGNKTLDVGKNATITIAENSTLTVGKNEEASIGKDRTVAVAANDSLDVGKNYVLNAADQITIKTGSASITMKKDGTIIIKGKDITLDGSGKINVKAASDVVIKGSKVTQN